MMLHLYSRILQLKTLQCVSGTVRIPQLERNYYYVGWGWRFDITGLSAPRLNLRGSV